MDESLYIIREKSVMSTVISFTQKLRATFAWKSVPRKNFARKTFAWKSVISYVFDVPTLVCGF